MRATAVFTAVVLEQMTIMKFIEMLLCAILLPVALTGCTAMLTSFVVMPIWILLGILFVLRRISHTSWRWFSFFVLLHYMAINAFLFLAWIENMNCRSCSQQHIELFTIYFFVASIMGLLTVYIIREMKIKHNIQEVRKRLLYLQIVNVTVTLTFTMVMFNS